MAEPDVNIIGTFQNKIGVIDGEVKTLAYLLHNVTIEVDMSDVENARDLDASRLRLNGHFEVFGGVETSGLRRWVFKVHQATRLGE